MPDLNSLVIFARVVEANSFSEAARQLKMPTSTVSRRIAELEDQLGVRLLDRSTRRLRLTDVGSEVLEHAQHGAILNHAVANIASNHVEKVSGTLRLSAPPSISDTLLAPLIGAFQLRYPDVRVQVLITERLVDHITEGVDLMFRIGALRDSTLVAKKLLSYRHQIFASAGYLKKHPAPKSPDDLLKHRLIAFSRWQPENRWNFFHVNGRDKKTVHFEPYLSMNDYAGLAPAILSGVGIGELPPVVRASIAAKERLVEVLPRWRFRTFDLWLLHTGNRHLPRAVRVFKDFAGQMAPTLFNNLPA